jgi:hypothetical protein
MSKTVQLLPDEFIPYGNIGSFWQIPKALAENEHLSPGAKLLYGVLVGLVSKRGTAWPKKETLQKHLGNPSVKTLYRWQRELVDAQLLRVHQKGRGLPNNYYLLRHPLLENTYTGQFDGTPRYVYTDPVTGERTLKTQKECWGEFFPVLNEWLEQQKTERTPMPKPHWRYDQKDYREVKKNYEDLVRLTAEGTPVASTESHINSARIQNEMYKELAELGGRK